MDGLKAARALKQQRQSSRLAWLGGMLAALLVVASFTPTRASVEQTSVENGRRVRVTVNAPASYDCGFDASGADEGLARHRMHALRSSYHLAARRAQADGSRV